MGDSLERMIKFFRKIRFNLMSQNQTGKYLKYALGEIILVMIGILLALQVNNWNEQRKNRNKESIYLNGIKNDLKSDAQNMALIISKFDDLNARFLLLDSLNKYELMNRSYLTELGPPMQLIAPPVKFRNNSGYFDSMISEGNSGLISNVELLSNIQNVYNINYKRLADIAQRIDQQADLIRWELRDTYYTRDSIFLKKSSALNVLSSMGLRNHYRNVLEKNRSNVFELIKLIEIELEKL